MRQIFPSDKKKLTIYFQLESSSLRSSIDLSFLSVREAAGKGKEHYLLLLNQFKSPASKQL